MKILALDYDGVIADSKYECLFVGFNAYLRLNKATRLFGGEKFTFGNFKDKTKKNKRLILCYNKLRVYVRDAFSWLPIFHIMEKGIKIKTQGDFDKIAAKLSTHSRLYVRYFYEERRKLQKQNFGRWLRLNKLFPAAKKIKALQRRFKIAIATANDRDAIEGFLKNHKLKVDFIVDRNFSTDKTKQIRLIRKKYNANFSDICFVDDQIAYFKEMTDLGVKCFLPVWGYNNNAQQNEAKKMGAVLLNERDFESKLAGN
jgi:phosphoglycolate phosphatase-like HAD superfamily hydrolase